MGGWLHGEEARFDEIFSAHQKCNMYDLFCEPILYAANVSSVAPFRTNCLHLGRLLVTALGSLGLKKKIW